MVAFLFLLATDLAAAKHSSTCFSFFLSLSFFNREIFINEDEHGYIYIYIFVFIETSVLKMEER